MGWKIGAVVSFLYTALSIIQMTEETVSGNIGIAIVGVICFVYCTKKVKERKLEKMLEEPGEGREEALRKREEYLKKKEAREKKKSERKTRRLNKEKVYKRVLHLSGLDVPANCRGKIRLKDQKLIMEFDGNETTLDIHRIVAIENTYDVDIERYEKRPGFAKRMAATAVFDLPGAILASIPETKENRDVATYAIITYIAKNGLLKKLVFKDAKDALGIVCAGLTIDLRIRLPELESEDKKEKKEKRKIEL